MPKFEMAAQIEVEDKRLSGALVGGKVLVMIYAIINVFVHAEYFEFLPIMPVSQGGVVNPDLNYQPNDACVEVQNAHCNDQGRMCTVITPDELVPTGTVYQDHLYVTLKIIIY